MPTPTGKPKNCTVSDCIKGYKQFKDLFNNPNDQTTINYTDSECIIITRGKNISGGQYKVKYNTSDGTMYFKPKIHRMWFYCSEDVIALAEDHTNYTVSPLPQ